MTSPRSKPRRRGPYANARHPQSFQVTPVWDGLAQRWAKITGRDPDTPADPPDEPAPDEPQDGQA